MKLLFDAVSTAEGDGGPFVHARETLRAWRERYPEDALLVVGPPWVAAELTGTGWEHVRWVGASRLTRALGHHVIVPWLAWRRSVKATLATLPVISPLNRCSRRYCYAHDWRHLSRPDEFSLLQRVYRKGWQRSAIGATATFCISRKTERETAQRWPGVRALLAENGVDHTRRWSVEKSSENRPPLVLTFGHRNNKRPELAIRALAATTPHGEAPRLVVVGATGRYREDLMSLADSLGVSDRCGFPGFVSDDELHQYFVDAAVVMLLSTDEGFGLPAGEALSLGVPVIGASDGGLAEIYGDAVIISPPDPIAFSTALDQALHQPSQPTSMLPTWGDAVDVVRQTILVDSSIGNHIA